MTTPLTLLASEAVALAAKAADGMVCPDEMMKNRAVYNRHAIDSHAALAAGYLTLAKALEACRRTRHGDIGNGYDMCPKFDPDHGEDAACECGADSWNAAIDAALGAEGAPR